MAIDRPLTTSEAAAGLGVSRSTVKNWIKEFSLGAVRDSRGDWRIDPETLPVFEEVKRLRDEGLGLNSIRRVIGVVQPSSGAKPGAITRFDEGGPEDEAHVAQLGLASAALQNQNQMAMELAKLAHLNGRLQTQLAYANNQVSTLQAQLKMAPTQPEQVAVLPDPAPLAEALARETGLKTELARTRSELAVAHKQIQAAERRIAELSQALKAAKESQGPRSGLGYTFAGASDDTALLELQKELIKAKERISAFEAADYERSEQRPWWNFWD